jgi:hypothetical protein
MNIEVSGIFWILWGSCNWLLLTWTSQNQKGTDLLNDMN